jgi:putative hemolysin
MKKFGILTIFLVVFSMIASCSPLETATPEAPDDPSAGLQNPASVYCIENGFDLQLRTGDDGGQFGVCVFNDGSECEEWAYYQGECGPVIEKTTLPEEIVSIRDAALAYIAGNYPDVALPAGGEWSAGISSNVAYSKNTAYRLTTGNWILMITHPIVPPESSTPVEYRIFLSNLHPQSTFFWRGKVDAVGTVTEIAQW